MVAGICNSVGGGVFLTFHRGVGGEYRSVSRLGLLTETGGCNGLEIRSFRLSWNVQLLMACHGRKCTK